MSSAKLVTPATAVAALAKKWEAHHANWLVNPGSQAWPLSVVLHNATEKDVAKDLPGTRDWVTSWRRWENQGQITWEPRRWPSGDQELPCRLAIASPEDLADLLGKRTAWARARRRHAQLTEQFPELGGGKSLVRFCDKVLFDYNDGDFERLTKLLQWFKSNPASGLYLRQLPVPSVDTKWVEPRMAVVGDLVAELSGTAASGSFHAICGLRQEPARMRMRILCPKLRKELRGLSDVESPHSDIDALQLRPRTFLVVENRNTGVALPDLPGAVAFMRLGLAVDQLDSISWLAAVPIQLYWGDIDTHGFAALARARIRFPALKSLLMDAQTLLSHKNLWVEEPSQSRVERPEGLTTEELQVYEGLRAGIWGPRVRLEQERIEWPAALAVLRDAVGSAGALTRLDL